MQYSVLTVLIGLVAISSAAVADVEGVRNVARDSIIVDRQSGNGNRPSPVGACCVANTSLKQDACTATDGTQGRCVPGGNACGSSLSCVAQANLSCDAAIIERGKSLCRAKAGNGQLIDGAQTISNLSQAKVN
ncbi:hypothetical protein BKA67DRAFT_661396 [Truncatella angustata]|uniref:Uncharacterized protein n=1 Tax=Truncatella angustata TaxID=152316 RepID=A0A9P8UEF9_9PEZI|nr:uncharacterized protein BKA67DRAFT_661396 [Truncatella angustata]KAH6648419.1 hypothetical protein BKA67DRAFT_661396 [Truncatella angustata]